MKRRSPTLEGFQTMFRMPTLGLAEIAWRWSFGVAAAAAFSFMLREYLATLPVTAGETLLLRSRQPALMAQALARILQGSAPRAAAAFLVVLLCLTLAWIVLVSLGRAATVKALVEHFRSSGRVPLAREAEAPPTSAGGELGSLMVLNFLRATALLAAAVSVVGAMLVARTASPADNPSSGAVLLTFWILMMLIGLAWEMLNWYLSLAALFVVRDGASAIEALARTTDLCRTRLGALLAVATWFGIARAIVFVVASSAAGMPLGFSELLPGGVIFGGVLLVTLLYFAAADFLYVGRLASYVFLLEPPELGPVAIALPTSEDDILSDIPGLVPPLEAAGG
jgi:hypothetical protein